MQSHRVIGSQWICELRAKEMGCLCRLLCCLCCVGCTSQLLVVVIHEVCTALLVLFHQKEWQAKRFDWLFMKAMSTT